MWGEVRIDIHKILEAYRKQACLWDPKHPGYKNKRHRETAYHNMIAELELPELTSIDIRLKIKSIRTSYRKELSLYLRAKEEGQCKPPKLIWFKQAHSFLKDISIPKPGRWRNQEAANENNDEPNKCETNVSDDDQSTQIWAGESQSIYNDDEDPIDLGGSEVNDKYNEDNSIVIDEYEIENDEQTNYKQINKNGASSSTISKNCSNHQCCDGVSQPEDDYQKFCNSVAAQLRAISDPYARSMAKFKIQHILFEAETGQYAKKVYNGILNK